MAPNGNVVLCQHGNRRIVELSPDMKVKLLVERSADGKHLSSPNDVVYTPDGSLYFTDPPFGLAKGNDDPAKEEPYNGVYRFKDGKAVADHHGCRVTQRDCILTRLQSAVHLQFR